MLYRFWFYGIVLLLCTWGVFASPSDPNSAIIVVDEIPQSVTSGLVIKDSVDSVVVKIEKVIPPMMISINTADAKTLDKLPGIGEVLAERIVLSRNELGPFVSVDDLQRVNGIGKKKCEIIAQHVIIE